MHPLVEIHPGVVLFHSKRADLLRKARWKVVARRVRWAQRGPRGLAQNKNISPGKNGAKGEGYMALKVIGAGFGRTGTWSTFAALNRLGFPCYHMQEVILKLKRLP